MAVEDVVRIIEPSVRLVYSVGRKYCHIKWNARTKDEAKLSFGNRTSWVPFETMAWYEAFQRLNRRNGLRDRRRP